MPRAKKDPWRCKARDVETGRRCRRKVSTVDPGLELGMCARHAKLHPHQGPKTDESRARSGAAAAAAHRQHGLYDQHWSEEERAAIAAFANRRQSLFAELDQARVTLRRLEVIMQRLRNGEAVQDSVEIIQEATPGPPDSPPITQRITRRVSQLGISGVNQQMDRALGRIAHLVQLIAELELTGSSSDPDTIAQQVRRGIQGMDSLTGGDEGRAAYEAGELER